MNNKPKIKIGIVAVSRDCFPESLSVNRLDALLDLYHAENRPDHQMRVVLFPFKEQEMDEKDQDGLKG